MQYNCYKSIFSINNKERCDMKKHLIMLALIPYVSAFALETSFTITVDDPFGTKSINETLVSNTHFENVDFAGKGGEFKISYLVTNNQNGVVIFDRVSMIQPEQKSVAIGDLKTGELTLHYYKQTNVVESRLEIEVPNGTYKVVVNNVENGLNGNGLRSAGVSNY